MIISEAYARRLIRQGKAEFFGYTESANIGDDWPHAILRRLDLQRVDHFPVDSVTLCLVCSKSLLSGDHCVDCSKSEV